MFLALSLPSVPSFVSHTSLTAVACLESPPTAPPRFRLAIPSFHTEVISRVLFLRILISPSLQTWDAQRTTLCYR